MGTSIPISIVAALLFALGASPAFGQSSGAGGDPWGGSTLWQTTLASDGLETSHYTLGAANSLEQTFLDGLPQFRFGEPLFAEDDSDWAFELHGVNRADPAALPGFDPLGGASGSQLLGASLRYRFDLSPRSSFELLGGLRFSGAHSSLDLPEHTRVHHDDLVVRPAFGGLFSVDLTADWYLGLQGDVADTGADGSYGWGATGMFGYRWKDTRSVLLGYRVLGYDFTEGTARSLLDLDLENQGPMLEFKLRF